MPKPTRPKKSRLLPTLAHIVLITGGISMLLPLLWMISTALKEPADVMSYPPEFIPRVQQTWRDPQTGVDYPMFSLLPAAAPTLTASEPLRVARLRTEAGRAEVVTLTGPNPGQKLLVPLSVPQDGRMIRALTPVKRVQLRWRNFPEAWNALTLQRNWMSWELPYQLNLGFMKIGPFHSGGLPIRNAFVAFYLNSLIVTILVTAGAVFTSSLSAFAFARLNFPGRDKLFLGYLGTMMVPQVVTMIPVFVLLKLFGWIDTYAAMILPPMFTAYGTFLLRQFFSTIPRELEDAARMDGCGLWGIYRHVIMPLSGPAIATLTTFIFLGTWNSFMWPLIVINSMEKRPLMLGLYAFMSRYNTEWTLLMAASLMVMAPVIIVFLLGQRYFVKGIVVSGMK
ncbi:MAG: carbohydrate ABC transporter permease [Armatimonadia bacterium]